MTESAVRGWVGPDRFGVLLVVVLLSFLTTPILEDVELGGLVIAVYSGLIAFVTLITCGVDRRLARWSVVLVVLLVVVLGAEALVSEGPAASWASGIVAAMLATTPYLVLRRVLGHERITAASVAGALCAYLLIGLTFGALFRTISAVDHEAFSEVLGGSANYLSFVTLTTLGFGDIVPESDLARSMVTLEAVLGQVVLVTLVARSVTMLGQRRLRP